MNSNFCRKLDPCFFFGGWSRFRDFSQRSNPHADLFFNEDRIRILINRIRIRIPGMNRDTMAFPHPAAPQDQPRSGFCRERLGTVCPNKTRIGTCISRVNRVTRCGPVFLATASSRIYCISLYFDIHLFNICYVIKIV